MPAYTKLPAALGLMASIHSPEHTPEHARAVAAPTQLHKKPILRYHVAELKKIGRTASAKIQWRHILTTCAGLDDPQTRALFQPFIQNFSSILLSELDNQTDQVDRLEDQVETLEFENTRLKAELHGLEADFRASAAPAGAPGPALRADPDEQLHLRRLMHEATELKNALIQQLEQCVGHLGAEVARLTGEVAKRDRAVGSKQKLLDQALGLNLWEEEFGRLMRKLQGAAHTVRRRCRAAAGPEAIGLEEVGKLFVAVEDVAMEMWELRDQGRKMILAAGQTLEGGGKSVDNEGASSKTQ